MLTIKIESPNHLNIVTANSRLKNSRFFLREKFKKFKKYKNQNCNKMLKKPTEIEKVINFNDRKLELVNFKSKSSGICPKTSKI